jgi:hypothetical protein
MKEYRNMYSASQKDAETEEDLGKGEMSYVESEQA